MSNKPEDPNEFGPERFRDYFKYISTVDAAGIVGTLALRQEFEVEPFSVGSALLLFGLSAYLCISGIFVLSRQPQRAETELTDWLVVLIFSLTTTGLVSVIGGALWPQ